MNLFQRVGIAIGIVGVAFAVGLALIPLPTQTNVGGTVLGSGISGTCGPGSSSSSALTIKLNPSSAVAGNPSNTAQEQQANSAWKDYCQGVANTRLELAGIVALLSIGLAVVLFRVLANRPALTTTSRDPLNAEQTGPPTPGWYRHSEGSEPRWWDGHQWGPLASEWSAPAVGTRQEP